MEELSRSVSVVCGSAMARVEDQLKKMNTILTDWGNHSAAERMQLTSRRYQLAEDREKVRVVAIEVQ